MQNNLYQLLVLLILLSCSDRNRIIDPTQNSLLISNPTVVLRTVYGNITLELYPDKAPNTVNRVINLIENGQYDGTPFHKVVPNFVIQTGDLSSRNPEESKKTIKAEINSIQQIKGTIAMARMNDDINSATTQFYIALTRLQHLDDKYTAFGQVVKGLEIIDKIKEGDKIITFTLIK